MLSEAWICGGRLPDDHRAIRIAIGCEKDEWERCWPLVSKFWREVDGYLVNDEQRETFEKTERLSVARSEAGSKGASKREANRQAKPPAKVEAKRMSLDQDLSLSKEQDQAPDQHHAPPSPSAPVVLRPADEVFQFWCSSTDRKRALFSPKRRKAVEARLKEGYSVDDLKAAIEGCKASPHHQGQNATGTVYDDLELICRSPEKVEYFARMSRGEGRNAQAQYAHHFPKAAAQEAAKAIAEQIELPPEVPLQMMAISESQPW